MATRQDEPAPGCRASQEQLLNSKDPLNIYDDCPMCEKLGVLCFVANHPSRPLLTSTASNIINIGFGRVKEWSTWMDYPSYIERFDHQPSFSELCDIACRRFNISEFFPYFTLRVQNGRDSMLFNVTEEHFYVPNNAVVWLVPRYSVIEFDIVSWSISFNRENVQTRCKQNGIHGEVRRTNINSIHVKLAHHDDELLHSVYREHFLDTIGKTDGHQGFIQNEEVKFEWGTLSENVICHRSTARREDGKSWEDEDNMSGSTHFNAPASTQLQHK
mmetsp:Transcript_19168/g.20786  ORF Transcript_19168/g.20786 Transcript_19168/m.20786 type:complete len:273 (-) Transcript_19168:58-876(-)